MKKFSLGMLIACQHKFPIMQKLAA